MKVHANRGKPEKMACPLLRENTAPPLRRWVVCAFNWLILPSWWGIIKIAGAKDRSLNMARRLFPDIDMKYKCDDGKADALHLARYAKAIS